MNTYHHRLISHSARSKRLDTAGMRSERAGQPWALQTAKIATYKATGNIMIRGLEKHFGGYKFMSSGFEQLVFASPNGDHALKILIASLGLPTDEIGEMASTYQDLSDRAKLHLADQWVETTFYPTSLPKILGGRAVVAVQPVLKPLRSFPDAEAVSDFGSDEQHRSELGRLVGRIKSLYKDTATYPDLIGAHNLVLSSEKSAKRLAIVDTLVETKLKLDSEMWNRRVSRRQVMGEIVMAWERSIEAPRSPIEFQPAAVH